MLQIITGKVIRSIRKEKGLSQEALAERSDLDRVFISYLENGHRQPTISSIFKIADGLGVEPEEIVLKVKRLYVAEKEDGNNLS